MPSALSLIAPSFETPFQPASEHALMHASFASPCGRGKSVAESTRYRTRSSFVVFLPLSAFICGSIVAACIRVITTAWCALLRLLVSRHIDLAKFIDYGGNQCRQSREKTDLALWRLFFLGSINFCPTTSWKCHFMARHDPSGGTAVELHTTDACSAVGRSWALEL